MAEILVTGKRISDMELIPTISGDEKIPTGVAGDYAITPEQIAGFVNGRVKAQWGAIDGDIDTQVDLKNKFTNINNTISSHVNSEDNPHKVTAEQVGLGNVDNTSDANKPLSNAVIAELTGFKNITDALQANKVDKDGAVLSVVGAVGDVDVNMISDALNQSKTLLSQSVMTSFNRTQEQKNLDEVSILDFGVVMNSPEDQTAKVDAFLDYLRLNKVKGVSPAGVIKVSCNKTKTFRNTATNEEETFKYALDISGVTWEGFTRAYRGNDGTHIQAIDRDGVVMFQNQVNVANTSCYLSGIRVSNGTCGLRLTYALHSRVSNFFIQDCIDGLILGEATMSAGALCNQFENMNIKVTNSALSIRGATWCNANVFTNCFFTGDKPSNINVAGGYGALANIFIGGEFNGASHGIELGNSRSTTFLGTYFEPFGHAVVLGNNARKVKLTNCVLGSTRTNTTESTRPCHIWHKSGTASVSFDGGSVFLANTEGLQDGMSLIYSDNPTGFNCHLAENPLVYIYTNLDWKLLDLSNVAQYASFTGNYQETFPITFSSSGGSITNLATGSSGSVTISGRNVHVDVSINLSSSSVLGSGDYYIQLPLAPKSTVTGVSRYIKVSSGSSLNTSSVCHMSVGNRNLFPWVTTSTTSLTKVTDPTTSEVSYTANTTNQNVRMSATTLSGYNTDGSLVNLSIDFQI